MRTLLLLVLAGLAAAATVDGIQIHSTVRGTGPKTVILVHGWTCDETSWSEQVPVWEKEFRIVTMDLPGHGKSGAPKTGELSMSLFARAVEAVRAEVGADKIALVGHSMGVPVIRQYARMFPAHVGGLVPVDGVLKLSGSANAPNPNNMKGKDGLKNRETMIRGMFGASATPAMQEKVLKMMLGAPEATAVQAMAATFAPANWTEEQINVPVYGMYADKSAAYDPPYFKQIFPQGYVTALPGTGHFVMMEKPVEFNRMVGAFLRAIKF